MGIASGTEILTSAERVLPGSRRGVFDFAGATGGAFAEDGGVGGAVLGFAAPESQDGLAGLSASALLLAAGLAGVFGAEGSGAWGAAPPK
jgi:hypothetical protein